MKLAVESRNIVKKKVKGLRKQEKVPGVIYGRHLENPISVVFDKVQLIKVIAKAGMSTPVELHGDGIDQLVLFHDFQFNPISDHLIHVDCLAVSKNEKVNAEVPVVLVGESPLVKNSIGRVQLLIDTLYVEALPMDLPHHIEIDVSGLTEDGQVLHISDVHVSTKVTLLGDESLAVVSAIAFKQDAEEEEEVVVEKESEEA